MDCVFSLEGLSSDDMIDVRPDAAGDGAAIGAQCTTPHGLGAAVGALESSTLAVCEKDPESPGSGASSSGKSNKASEPCKHCQRIAGISRDFLEKSKYVKWSTTTGRGWWCMDCYTVYRTVFDNEVALVRMPTWLNDQANRLKFSLCLVGYLALKKRAPGSRITQAAILQQVESFQFLSRMLCIPLGPSVVRCACSLTF